MNWKTAAAGLLTLCVLAGSAVTRGESRPALAPASIDTMIRAAWKSENVVPAPPVDDARYLRRIYLDLTGAIPPPDVVTAFLADHTADKRERAVATLLDAPAYAEHFTDYWDKILLGRVVAGNLVDRLAFRT